jgi:hypothetical protein
MSLVIIETVVLPTALQTLVLTVPTSARTLAITTALSWFSLVSLGKLRDIEAISQIPDRLCGLVVRVLGYRSGGPGSIPGTTRKENVVCLERGPLSLVSTTEELLDRKVAAPV